MLRLVARGRTDREIAQALMISEVTVHHHVRHVYDIYDKIGVSTRAGAALFAMEHDLIQPPGSARSPRHVSRGDSRSHAMVKTDDSRASSPAACWRCAKHLSTCGESGLCSG